MPAGEFILSNLPVSGINTDFNINIVGIITAIGGFISIGNTTPIKIALTGNILSFTAVGIGSTFFKLT